MKNVHANISMFLALSLSGLGASGCSDDSGDSITGPGGETFEVTITSPSSEPTYSTACNSVFLSGGASIYSGEFDRLRGLTVTWSNQATGTSGVASSTLEWCTFLGYTFVCGVHWEATVLLAVGDNLITVTATDASNGTGHRSITVHKPAPSYSVSGKVVNQSGIGIGGFGESAIKIALTGAGTSTYRYSEQDGSYAFSCIVPGSYDLTPSSSSINYAFSPPARTVTVTDADVAGQDFSAEAYWISGQVTYPSGLGVEWVRITLTGANSSATYWTESDGRYSFLVPNGTYTVEPTSCGLGCPSFTPASRTVTVDHADVFGQDFAATASSTIPALPGHAPD